MEYVLILKYVLIILKLWIVSKLFMLKNSLLSLSSTFKLLLLFTFFGLQLPFFSKGQNVIPDFWDGKIYVKLKQNSNFKIPSFSEGRDQLKFNDDFRNFPEIIQLIKQYEISDISRASVNEDPVLNTYYKVKFKKVAEVKLLMSDFDKLPYIELTELIPIMRQFATPNDINPKQWHLPKIDAANAWNLTTGSKEVVVAIVDDAVKITHQDLKDNIWKNPREIPSNGKDDDGNGFIDDINGWDISDNDFNPNPPEKASNSTFTHGTHCAGIAGAATNNGKGIASIGYNIKIMAVKCAPDDHEDRTIPNAYEGVDYAIKAGANVISMSWGGSQSSSFGDNLFNTANKKGIVLVAAAGNDNSSATFYPAGSNHVIGVGATDRYDQKANFSNYGDYIDVMAPGVSIYSTLAGSDQSYGFMDGTSMACPLVAGLAGLMLSYNKSMKPDEVLRCLQQGSVNIDAQNKNFIGKLGSGRINAYNSVFCLPPVRLVRDLAVAEVSQPIFYNCTNVISPVFTLHNIGKERIESTEITYFFDNELPSKKVYSLSLDSTQSTTLNLQPETLSEGPHTLHIICSNPNGKMDLNTINDTSIINFVIMPPPTKLPFKEDFENGFDNNNWSIDNPDNSLTWEIVNAQGNGPGKKSARVHSFEYGNPGQRDGLITPPIDLSNYEDIKLTFRHAYRRFSQDVRDSLIIYVSTDCGSHFDRVFSGGGGNGFATESLLNKDFVPIQIREWCGIDSKQECFEIDLNNYKGDQILIRFEIFNSNGNNIYIDDINITGKYNPQKPIAAFEVSNNKICRGGTVNFKSISKNANGATFEWSFAGGDPSFSNEINPTVKYDSSGTFPVSLKVTTKNGEDFIIQKDILRVISPDSIEFTPKNPSVCKGNLINLKAKNASIYTWEPKNLLNTSAGDSVWANIDQTTTFTITTRNEVGCELISFLTVNVIENYQRIMIQATPSICLGSSGILTAMSGTNHVWSPKSALKETTGSQVTATPSVTTTFTVDYLNDAGCQAQETITIEVERFELKVGSAEVLSCSKKPSKIYAFGAESYKWEPSEGLSSNKDSVVIASPKETTIYTVTGTKGNCSAKKTVKVTPFIIKADFSASTTEVDLSKDPAVQFENLSENAAYIRWSFGDGDLSSLASPSHTYKTVGDFEVMLVASSPGCSDTAKKIIKVFNSAGREEQFYRLFSIHPNPAKNILYINNISNRYSPDRMRIINSLGIEILNKNYSNELNLDSLPSGIYYLEISDKSNFKNRIPFAVIKD